MFCCPSAELPTSISNGTNSISSRQLHFNQHFVCSFAGIFARQPEKIRSSRPITFAADLNLHTFDENEIGPSTDWCSADERKYSKKQKILMNVSPSSTVPSTKHQNGHGCRGESSDDYNNDIEWPWMAGDDGAVDVEDVDNGHGKYSNAIYSLKRLLSRVFAVDLAPLPDAQPMHEHHQHSSELK